MGFAEGTEVLPLVDGGALMDRLNRGRGIMEVDGAKVFTATKFRDRENLGAEITKWRQANRDLDIVDVDVRQSSDSEFHCLSIVIWYLEPGGS